LARSDEKAAPRRRAEARLSDVAEEARSLLAEFPDLHRGDLPFQAPARVRGRSLARAGTPPNGVDRRASTNAASQAAARRSRTAGGAREEPFEST
jgi:hypothetical protein